MPKRTDIKKILLIGAGPIVIGQACEFDYSGTQACKSLKEEGYEVILVNSNPATIMTDPEFADRTYIEPVTPEVVEKIIARDRPDALLPTMGGQTALNLAIEGERKGLWKFKDNTYKGTLPKVRPMILSEALEKWPDSRLYCDANNMCRPKTEEDIQEGNNEVKNVDNTSNGNVNGTSGDGE